MGIPRIRKSFLIVGRLDELGVVPGDQGAQDFLAGLLADGADGAVGEEGEEDVD